MPTYVVTPKSSKFWHDRLFEFFQICFAGWALYWTPYHHWIPFAHLPPPGYSVAVLACVAALMSIQGETSAGQKAGWMLIIGAFLIVELSSIRADRAEVQRQSIKDRKDQDLAFAGVLEAQNRTFSATTDGFTNTYTQVKGVLNTTQRVAAVAKKNLDNVTGGESFAYVYPKFFEGSNNTSLYIHNDGDQVLSTVTYKIVPVVRGSFEPNSTDAVIGNTPRIEVGTLAPHEGRMLEGIFRPIFRTDGSAYYHVWINAQNTGVGEELYLRRSANAGVSPTSSR